MNCGLVDAIDPGGGTHLRTTTPKSSGARYKANYNVRRWLSGGVDNFGFTRAKNQYPVEPHAIYTAKSRGKIRVSVFTFNTAELPWVYLADGSGYLTPQVLSNREFEVDAVEGRQYSLYINNPSETAMYGFVTLSQQPAVPPPVVAGYVQNMRTGDGVPNASVSVDGRNMRTNSEGYYEMPLSQPGVFNVRVSASQYEPEPTKSVSIIRGTKQVNFYLRPFSDHY